MLKKCMLLSLTGLLLFLSGAMADVIKIKNGGRVECVIIEESEERVLAEVKFGKLTLTRDDIESIKRVSKKENTLLMEKWGKEIQRTKKTREYTDKKTATKAKTLKTRQSKSVAKPQSAKQKPKRKPGVVKLVNCDDGVHSYASILPSDYDKKRKYPVLFCFDPGGDGAGIVRRFAFAAEKYGWIIVGSLNVKNGPWKPILKAQKAMLKDIPKKYNVDQNRYYATGFSGGARMSYSIAYANPTKFKGVIACGAGFGQGSISKRVAVYHCVGKTDFNADEVKEAHATLKKKKISSKLNIFPGAHEYPPDIVLRQAVDWIASR